ncbi:MAG: ribosome maturation factor RimP [Candidatus Latescibacterota bacterium]
MAKMQGRELEEIITPELEILGVECIKCEVVGGTGSEIVKLYIDKPGGVSIKDCAVVSRALGNLLERLDVFPGRYLLEVSSPGSQRPLTRESHYVKYIDRLVRVQRFNEAEGKKTYTGTIRSCINGLLVLDTSEGKQEIKMTEIIQASLADEIFKIDKKMKDSKRKKGGAR